MNILLLILAIFPSIGLLLYAKNKSNYTTQPISLLVKYLLFGSLTIIPIYILETVFDVACLRIIDTYEVYAFVNAFFCAGAIEELFKLTVLYVLTIKYDKYFKALYDGIIYSICVALGYSILEDLLYIFIYYGGDLSTALLRAVTPGHFCFSIFMGILFSEAKKYEKSNKKQFHKYIGLSFAVPMLIHGLYDYCIGMGGSFLLVFVVLLIFLYVYAFRNIKNKSKDIYFI